MVGILDAAGYETESATSGFEALEKLDSSIDLVLLDILMPGMDGFEVIRRIRDSDDIGDVPIIVVTCLDGRDARIRAIQLGANDFISRPVDRTELTVRIAAQMRIRDAQDALRQSESKYRTIAENANLGIFTTSVDGTFLQANPALAKMTGYESVEELLAIRAESLYLRPEDRKWLIKDLLEQGSVKEREILARNKDGSVRWLALNAVIQKDHRDSPVGIVGIVEDITDRKKAEEALRDSEEKYRLLFSHEKDAILLSDAETMTIQDANESAVELWGYSREELLGMRIPRLSAEPENTEEALAGATRFGGYEVSLRRLRKRDGTEFFAEISANPLTLKCRSVVYSIVRDITERRKAQEALIHREKFRAVVDLTSGVAHNFNNLLQIVMGNASLGLMNLQSGDFSDLKEKLDQIIESSKFGAETVRRLNRYARGRPDGQTVVTKVFDLSDLVGQAVEMSRPWWKTEPEKHTKRVSLDTRLKSGCTIRGDKSDMFEVVVNVIRNAAEALLGGGDIEIDTAVEDNAVVLRVTDSGIGIRKENLNRLFTPFFTTNAEAGRGLGLATCRRIVEAHGGTILVDSVEGKGTTFRISLPFVPEEVLRLEDATEKSPERALTILAVDAMEPTVKMLQAGLGRFGHTVLTALSGEEALKIFRDNPIDLVICDLGMPGTNGWEVARTVKQICHERQIPKTPFVVFTGWDDQTHEKEEITESGVDAVVQKPVEITKLLEVIREVLQHGRMP